MARASTTTSIARLQALCARGASGRLTVGAGAGECSLYLLDGEVVGVRAADDAVVLVERMASAGLLPVERARQLQAMQAMSLPILGREGSDPILGLLLDQLEGDAVADLLDHRFDEVVGSYLAQPGEPNFEPNAAPWAHLVRTTGETLARLKRIDTWITAASVVDPGRLLTVSATPPTNADDVALTAALADGPLTAADLVAELGWPEVAGRGRIAGALERGAVVDALPPATSPPTGDDAVEDAATEASLLADTSHIDDEALEAFSGAEDERRGGSRDGTFVQSVEDLDRVEILEEDEPSQVREGVGYSAPSLSEEDAFDKVGVANEVLRAALDALAETSSPADARRTLQVLVDGRPRQFAALFEGIQIAADGSLPIGPLLVNLRKRLPSEQRHHLNQGLLDLLDQTLDRAAEEIEGDGFDELLEQVIGYRQRLGL